MITSTNYSMLVDGESIAAQSGDTFERKSPAHDVLVGRYPRGGVADTDAAVVAARRAFDSGPWPRWSGAQRARVLRRVAELIERDLESLARIESLEGGKPISQARGEVSSTAELWWYAATLPQHAYGDAHNAIGEQYLGIIVREPLGVVGMVTPWNFPLLIVSQKLPFALAVGNTAVIKPAELTSGTTIRLAELCREAGMPDGVVNVVTGPGREVGNRLAEHPGVDMITFTGSTAVGKRIMATAASTVKKVELELGGKNPQIVMADANFDRAVDAVVFGVYFNQGECCNSGSRLLVQDSVADEFVARVVDRAREVRVGDPLDDATLVGAIASPEQYNQIESLVEEGKASGAELLLGGGRYASETGRFFEPTVFDHVTPTMSIATEEIFGPVLSVLRFSDVDQALEIANATVYGLSAGIWTQDIDQAVTFARRARAGTVWVNCWMDGFPEMSFGGYKESGLGRELGRAAIEEFTELKTIAIHTGPKASWVDGVSR
ncbi:aldehyde dehydrogenase family protein [Cellulomonas sp.]|uniref:aldehyde dehydrogenase family protein n=1 Tax=Cellulomonas sp. TaxID=40001 RepID=UPI003BADB348